MGFKRVVKRSFEELKATLIIAKVTSIKKALITFKGKILIQKMAKNNLVEKPKYKKILVKKHDVMNEYFDETFKEYLENYKVTKDIEEGNKEYSNNIWICWFQGIEDAPEIVKTCVNSIKNNSGVHNVVILTDDNYRNYVDIPDIIEKRRKEGIISRTAFSDILRMCLLAKHGGMWLDSTFFAIGDLGEYFKLPIWSIKRPNYLHCSVASGYFAGYSLYCDYEHRYVFKVISDFLCNYWIKNDILIDYLVVDYCVSLALRHYKEIKLLFDNIPSNNPLCDELCKVLNDKFDQEKYNELIKDTILFKLTWKANFNRDGTFYEYIVNKQ